MSKESNSGIISGLPEVPGRKTKRIIVLDGRVQVAGKGLQVGLRRFQLCGGSGRAGGGERSSGSGSRKEDSGSGLHREIFCV